MLSWFSSATIAGTLLGAPIGGFILYSLAAEGSPSMDGFRNIFLVSGGFGVLSLLFAFCFLRGKETVQTGLGLKGLLLRFGSGIKEVVSDRRIVVTSSMEGLQNMTVGALEAFLPIYAVTVAGLNEFQAGLLWGVQVLVTMLSKPIMGKTSDRYGRKPLIVSGMLLCAVSFGCIPLLKDFHSLLIAAIFFGLGEAFVTSSSAAMVADFCKEKHFGTAMGTFGTIFDIGHASGLEERIVIYADRLVDIITDPQGIVASEIEAEARFEEILRQHQKYGKSETTLRRYLGYHQEIQGLIKGAVSQRGRSNVGSGWFLELFREKFGIYQGVKR
jgi:MFS family permease